VRNGLLVRAHLRIPAIVTVAALSLSACDFDQSMRSYDATMRPTAVAKEFEPLIREINAGLNGNADVADPVQNTTCGGDWKNVQDDPLGVENSPYQLTREVYTKAGEPAEALRVMTSLRPPVACRMAGDGRHTEAGRSHRNLLRCVRPAAGLLRPATKGRPQRRRRHPAAGVLPADRDGPGDIGVLPPSR
jgi:hypothetical protein